jgi:hypothetical protein
MRVRTRTQGVKTRRAVCQFQHSHQYRWVGEFTAVNNTPAFGRLMDDGLGIASLRSEISTAKL